MDWKSWYRDEVQSGRGREAILSAIDAWPEGDPEIRRVLRAGGAASFPHTTLVDSAVPLARVATSIVAEGYSRVVALGVLHGSVAPEGVRPQFALAARGDRAAMARVGGAFVADDAGAPIETPFGSLTAGTAPKKTTAWVRRDDALLEHEFSLDLFAATLAAASRGAPAPTLHRVFVGPVGTAGDEMPVVRSLADALRPLCGPDVALVATGDLVHAGHGYSTAEEAAALPRDAAGLASHFEGRVRAMLDGAMKAGAPARAAEGLARELRSDMRNVLPVLAAILGAGARARLVSFQLTDYGPILSEPSPCVVASALVAFEADGATFR